MAVGYMESVGLLPLHLKLQKLEVLRAGGHYVRWENRHSWTLERQLEPLRTVWKPQLFLLPLTLPHGAQHTLSPESDQLNVGCREKKPSRSQAQPHTIQERQQNVHRVTKHTPLYLHLSNCPRPFFVDKFNWKHAETWNSVEIIEPDQGGTL